MKDPKRPGRWKAGESGNPAGRKPGSGEVAKVRAAIAEHVPAVIAKLVEGALAGDIGAARLLLERTIAPLKAVEEKAELTMPDGTLTDQGRAVVAAIAAGDLAPGQGAALLTSLGVLAKLTEADELEQRIKALEDKHAVNKS
jgi:HAMP domain-containing protein